MIRSLAVSILFLSAAISFAEIPPGYYDPAQGLSGEALQWALHEIIDNHDPVSYDYLWTAFYTTDDRYGDKVWDMYSDIPGGSPPYLYTLGDDQGGSASGEGEGYNREHSWPKSWFGDDYPMNTDLFHIVPTDIYVNNRRGNYPYAEVGSATWTSLNGSRLGTSCTPGYSGIAFEPVDGYKGDFARNYFYMATRYKGEDAGWPGSAMADGADLEDWAVTMLLQWHLNDPVSAKEIERNEAVYAIQENRNPFIDHPEFAQMIYDPTAGCHGTEQNEGVSLLCSPNPSHGTLSVQITAYGSGQVNIGIFDLSGRSVAEAGDLQQGSNGNLQCSFDLSPFAPGIYFTRASTAGTVLTVPFLLID